MARPRIYLDHAATSPLRPEAKAAMEEGFALWANPSSPHAEGRKAKQALEDARARVKAALGWDGEVIFLHEVRKGAADRSYGVQVAQLAGLPPSVIARARVVLEALEKGEREGGATQKTLIDDLPLFAVAPAPAPQPKQSSKLEETLAEIIPDELSPREALDLLYKLKEAAKT